MSRDEHSRNWFVPTTNAPPVYFIQADGVIKGSGPRELSRKWLEGAVEELSMEKLMVLPMKLSTEKLIALMEKLAIEY